MVRPVPGRHSMGKFVGPRKRRAHRQRSAHSRREAATTAGSCTTTGSRATVSALTTNARSRAAAALAARLRAAAVDGAIVPDGGGRRVAGGERNQDDRKSKRPHAHSLRRSFCALRVQEPLHPDRLSEIVDGPRWFEEMYHRVTVGTKIHPGRAYSPQPGSASSA